jgi:ABC-2 type transport system ATP-binding protein
LPSGEALLEAVDLTKRYGPRVLALDALSVKVEPGIIGLVGANGAGKSTLIKILLGLLQPTSGSATLLGYDVRTQGPILRQYVGYMPEHDCLPPDVTATDFVSHMAQISGIPRGAARERTAEALRLVGLFEERYREMSGYSTGMKQRVKLAQSLVHAPRLVLLDEPTNGLDPAGRDEMLDLIHRVGREFGIAVIMSSHLLGEIERVCDHLMVISAGRLVRSGSIEGFRALTQMLAVEVESGAEVLARRLRERGLEVGQEGRTLEVVIGEPPPFELIRDTVADLGLALLRMERRRQTLEDLFQVTAGTG